MKRIMFTLMILVLLGLLQGCRGGPAQDSELTATQSATQTVEPGDTPTAGPPAEDMAGAVLRETAELICPYSDAAGGLEFATTGYGFHCAPAAGHGTGVRMEEYGSEAEARAAFDAGREGSSVEEFNGFPLSVWGEDHPSFPGGRDEYRVWMWQGGRWLVEIRAFDDTPYLVAPDPQEVSEALYRAGTEHGLFAGADG